MRLPTSAICHQSALASPGASRKPRWREMRRSELVTVPSFSPQPSDGRRISAWRAVSVLAMTSETTTKGQALMAASTAPASGMETTGLVAMIHSALMRPSATALNISTALRPGFCAMAGEVQKRCTRSRSSAFSITIWAASILASPPTSRPPMAFGCPVSENGPIPGRPMRPVARWQLMMALTLSVPLCDWLTPWL
ncbi:hypothetical protein D3C78_1184750 [compost metagenome]